MQPARPRISVVTPSFNQAEFLEECIRSVLDQNYPDLEYLILDGGSTDGSVDLIKKYAPRLTYWVSERDHGQADAINKGFRRATGSIVAWLNADDIYLPGTLDHVARAVLSNPNASFYFGNGWRMSEDGTRRTPYFQEGQLRYLPELMIHGLNYILQPSTFIQRHHLEQIGYLDAQLKYGLDTDLWLRLAQVAPPQPLLEYLSASREYGRTKTSTGSFARVEELRQIAERHSQIPMTPGALCYYLDTLSSAVAQNPEIYPPHYRRLLERFWHATSQLFELWDGGPDSFPRRPSTPVRTAETPAAGTAEQTVLATPTPNQRLKIGIEMKQTVLGHAGGIAVLMRGVFQELMKQHPEHDYTVYCTVFNRSLLEPLPASVTVHTLPYDTYLKEVDRLAHEAKLDVLFRAYPLEERITFPSHRQIFLIPDIQHEYLPEFFSPEHLRSRRAAFTQALSSAGAIAAISEYARRSLLQQECTQCRDIFLMTPALPREQQEAARQDLTERERHLIPTEEFFLFPANLWPHKNHRRLCQAFALLLEQTRRPLRLVFTGHPHGWEQLQAEFPQLPLEHLGYVRPALLRALFQKARAVVFFSLHEGFGMPLLEAFDAGGAVLCSNTTSLPEVGGDAVLTCDPTDVQAQAQLMRRILEEPGLREELSQRGQARVRAYSWHQSAANLHEALVRVATRPEPATPTLPQILTLPAPPLVSIVTPSYNQGRFLKRTIESVLNQTYPHIEYRVCDGGSKDESVDVLKSYGDRFWWISEKDRGQTHAINKGLSLCQGSIQAYLNSDDVLLPNAVEKAVLWFEKHRDCDMVYGRAQYINEDDEVIGMYNSADYSFERLMQDCCVCQPAAFWRSHIAHRIGPFNESLHFAMDYDYWIRIDRSGGRIMHTRDILACSRIYPETKTMSCRQPFIKEIIRVCLHSGGFVDLGAVRGLWHHLCYEKPDGWARRLRWVPLFFPLVTRLHHKALNARKQPLPEVLRRTARAVVRRLPPLELVYRQMAPSLRQYWKRLKGGKVIGFSLDNWLEPLCSIQLAPSGQERAVYLAGVAPVDMTLTVRIPGEEHHSYPLRAKQLERVELRLRPGDRRKLELEFSQHVPGPERRKRAFLLQDTNLFSDADL